MRHNLETIYHELGKYAEAALLYQRDLQIQERALGWHHPKTTETRTKLIALLHTMGHHEEAAKLEDIQSEP